MQQNSSREDLCYSESVDVIAYFIPVFIILIIAEFLYSSKIKRQVYRFNDTINDLSQGILNQMVELFFAGFVVALYYWCYEQYHFFNWEHGAWWVWVLAFLGTDFAYYWFHRTAHERNFAWAVHVPHHQSEEYNFSVALRQGALEGFVSIWFRLPFAFLGIPPNLFLTTVALNIVFQFFVHTRLIKSLGPLEWFMNTPSHHRVHHACNPKYLDCNYGGMFIIWDRLFGSFVPEEEEPTYGLTSQLASWNSGWAQGAHFVTLIKHSTNKSILQILRLWFWDGPSALGPPPVAKDIVGREKYNPYCPSNLNIYIAVQFTIVTVLFSLITNIKELWSTSDQVVISAYVLTSLLCFGAIFENHRSQWVWEFLRNLIFVAITFIVFEIPTLAIIAILSPIVFIQLQKNRGQPQAI